MESSWRLHRTEAPDGAAATRGGMTTRSARARRQLRALAWRLGRFVYRWARREGDNRPDTNGEYWLLGEVVRTAARQPLVLMDIGANKGDWSAEGIRSLRLHGRTARIHAFEPTPSTYELLSGRFEGEPYVSPHRLALSDQRGESSFYLAGELSGRNSLLPIDGAPVETVQLQSVDGFLNEQGIEYVDLVKSDAEGCDLTVLKGAVEALRSGRIDVWQFEYNHRWLANGASLLAVFRFISGLPYRLGKLYGDGIDLYDEWHPELDRFIETNYVLVRRGSAYESLARSVRFDVANVAG